MKRPRLRIALPAIVLLLAGGWVYSPALRGAWIWDDSAEISQNAAVQDPAGLGKIWLAPVGADYLPVKTTVQWAEWRLFVDWAQEIATNNLGLGASATAINNFAQGIVKYPTGFQGLVNAVAHESDLDTVSAKGWEFNLIYNPLRNWTMKFTADQDNAVNSNAFPGIQAYFAARLPVWTTATDPVLGPFWTTISAGNESDSGGSPQQYLASQVDAAGVDLSLALEGQRQSDLARYHFTYLTNYQFVTGKLTGFGLGTAVRYESAASIGYLGSAPDPSAGGAIDSLNPHAVIWDKVTPHQDAWVSYRMRLPFIDSRIRSTLQLNCRDIWSRGYLLTVAVNPDGTPVTYRIVPPRQWYLQETFDF